MLASEKLRRNWSVVRNSMGFPGTSSRPASSMSPFSARLLTVFDESTPLSWSMNARVTGWRYAMMVSTSSAASDSAGGLRDSVTRRTYGPYIGRDASCSLSSIRSSMMPRFSKS